MHEDLNILENNTRDHFVQRIADEVKSSEGFDGAWLCSCRVSPPGQPRHDLFPNKSFQRTDCSSIVAVHGLGGDAYGTDSTLAHRLGCFGGHGLLECLGPFECLGCRLIDWLKY